MPDEKPTIFLASSVFEAMLLSLRTLTANDKQKMKAAIETQTTPAEPDLAGFFTVYRHASQEERGKMIEALNEPPPAKPPLPDAIASEEEIRATLTLFKLMTKTIREHIAAALDTGFDCLTKDELYAYGQFAALVTATEGEYDGELADLFGITPERIAALRVSELEAPPEQYDLFRDPIEQKKAEAARKLKKLFPMSQTAGYNAIIAITAKNSEVEKAAQATKNEAGEDIVKFKATMTRRNKKGHASVTVETESKDLKILENKERILKQCETAAAYWRTSTKKLLDYSIICLTAQNTHVKAGKMIDLKEIETLISFTLEDWGRLRGVPLTDASIDNERARVKEDCETLLHTHFHWEKKSRGGRVDRWGGLNPIQKAEIKNNQISIRLSQDFSAYLLQAPISPYRIKLLSTDERNPNAYALARKLGDYANIKNNSDRHKNKPIENQYKISVEALLDCTSIPKLNKVEKGNYRLQIITPFLKAMEEAERVLELDWGFVSDEAEPQIIDKNPPKKIEDFLKAYIVFSFRDEESLQKKPE